MGKQSLVRSQRVLTVHCLIMFLFSGQKLPTLCTISLCQAAGTNPCLYYKNEHNQKHVWTTLIEKLGLITVQRLVALSDYFRLQRENKCWELKECMKFRKAAGKTSLRFSGQQNSWSKDGCLDLPPRFIRQDHFRISEKRWRAQILVLLVPLLPQLPMGKAGLVRAPRWARLLSPFHMDVFAEERKSSVLLPAPGTWRGTGKLMAQLQPDQESSLDPGSGLCRDQSILQRAAVEASSVLGTQLPGLGASCSAEHLLQQPLPCSLPFWCTLQGMRVQEVLGADGGGKGEKKKALRQCLSLVGLSDPPLQRSQGARDTASVARGSPAELVFTGRARELTGPSQMPCDQLPALVFTPWKSFLAIYHSHCPHVNIQKIKLQSPNRSA